MKMKSVFVALSVSLGMAASAAAPKIPKAPKTQTKKEAELLKCIEASKSVTRTSPVDEIKSASQCNFWVAEQAYTKFTALKLPKAYDKDKIKTWLDDSTKQRELASETYIKAAQLDNKETVVASYARIGLISYQLATSIQSAPMPTHVELDSNGDGKIEKVALKGDVKTQAHEAVKVELNKIADPILADAKAAFEKCSSVAKDNKIENDWSKFCDGYLLVLNPPAEAVKPEKGAAAPSNGLPIVEKKPGGVVKN
jgi:hypothetical protein